MVYKYITITLSIVGIWIWITSPQFSEFLIFAINTIQNFRTAFWGMPVEVRAAWSAVPLIVSLAIYTIFY